MVLKYNVASVVRLMLLFTRSRPPIRQATKVQQLTARCNTLHGNALAQTGNSSTQVRYCAPSPSSPPQSATNTCHENSNKTKRLSPQKVYGGGSEFFAHNTVLCCTHAMASWKFAQSADSTREANDDEFGSDCLPRVIFRPNLTCGLMTTTDDTHISA